MPAAGWRFGPPDHDVTVAGAVGTIFQDLVIFLHVSSSIEFGSRLMPEFRLQVFTNGNRMGCSIGQFD